MRQARQAVEHAPAVAADPQAFVQLVHRQRAGQQGQRLAGAGRFAHRPVLSMGGAIAQQVAQAGGWLESAHEKLLLRLGPERSFGAPAETVEFHIGFPAYVAADGAGAFPVLGADPETMFGAQLLVLHHRFDDKGHVP